MRVVRLLKENRSICENSEGVVTFTSVAKALCANPSENLCHKVMLVLSVLEEEHRDSRIRSDSNVRSCARNFVNFIHQSVEPNNGKVVKWENLVESCEKRDKNGKRRNVFDTRNILVSAGIIECTEGKDGCFVSIKSKDKFEKLRNSLNSKTLKNTVIKKKKSVHK